MSRRRAAEKRQVLPDAKYGDVVVGKFMNCLMFQGKKSVAERIVYGAFDEIHKKIGVSPVEVFRDTLDSLKPELEVRSRRVGGQTYQVPMDVRPDRAQALAIRWLIDASRKRGERTMKDRLCAEILDARENRGAASKKREDTHKMAEANRAFAHFRW
jgi:small subunit ribosomal protein S7